MFYLFFFCVVVLFVLLGVVGWVVVGLVIEVKLGLWVFDSEVWING